MNNQNLPMRDGVGVIILNKNDKVFVGKRKDNPGNNWQMPQGGVDEGEDYITAMKRELLEETSIQNIEIIKEIDKIYQYELPENLIGIIWKGKYRGQKQKWFITRFLGEEKEINLKTKHAEFIDWKWIEPKLLPEVIVNFKLLYGYAALLPEEENKYKKFTKSIQRRAATIGGQDMNDYPLKMLIFNRARLVKNSKNRIPYGIELIQKYERDSWIVFTENKKQAKEFNKIVNKLKGFNSGIYNTDLNDDERQENLEKFKAGNLNVLVSCTALDEGFDMPEADGAMILSASSSKRQRIQRMGRVLRITANKENALIVTVYSSKTEYEKLREESNRYKLEGVPVKWQQMSL